MISGRAVRAGVRSAAGPRARPRRERLELPPGLRANRRRKGGSSWHQGLPGRREEAYPHRRLASLAGAENTAPPGAP